jgi:hypothetical protein
MQMPYGRGTERHVTDCRQGDARDVGGPSGICRTGLFVRFGSSTSRTGRQSTTIPNGAAPPGIATGEPESSVIVVPSTAKALTFATPASTTYR